VFYFGNEIGETGNSPTDAAVDATDVAAVHNNYTASAGITNPYDFNRDKVVDATDEAIAAANQSNDSPLLLITVPGGVGGAGSSLAEDASTVPATATAASGSEVAASAVVDPSLAFSAFAFAPTSLSLAPIAFGPTTERSSSVDAAFEAFAPQSGQATSAASLLNLRSGYNEAAAKFSNGDDTDQSHNWHASDNCDDSLAADDAIASEFPHEHAGVGLRILLKRL
jgi:hypothetical protein